MVKKVGVPQQEALLTTLKTMDSKPKRLIEVPLPKNQKAKVLLSHLCPLTIFPSLIKQEVTACVLSYHCSRDHQHKKPRYSHYLRADLPLVKSGLYWKVRHLPLC